MIFTGLENLPAKESHFHSSISYLRSFYSITPYFSLILELGILMNWFQCPGDNIGYKNLMSLVPKI